MPNFKIYKSEDGYYSVLFKIKNRMDFFSTKHEYKSECYKTIQLIHHLSTIDRAFSLKSKPCGSWLFYITNLSTGEKIGESQTYLSKKELMTRLRVFRLMLSVSKVDAELYTL